VRSVPLKMTKELWIIRPDILILCNATQVFMALATRWFLNYRIALLVEDTPHATRNLSWLSRKLKAFAYRRADCWYVFSEDARNYLTNIGIKSGIQYSPWSLDMNAFNREGADSYEFQLQEEKVRKRTVIFVGQFIPWKGIILLLEAWASLPENIRAGAKLILAGDGPLRQQAEEICKNHELPDVTFLGNVPNEQVKQLLRRADLFVLPTLQDLYSISVLEAMASGCPVIITPYAGSRELVERGRNGWLVDPTVPGALTAVLAHALSDKVNLRQMGLAARKRVESLDNAIVMANFAESLRRLAVAS
jgi:glycosyltransferase involved in cell wall biosynthesis